VTGKPPDTGTGRGRGVRGRKSTHSTPGAVAERGSDGPHDPGRPTRARGSRGTESCGALAHRSRRWPSPSTRSQLTDLGQELGFDIAAGLALRTRDDPARDRRRDDREQREPAEEQERGDGARDAVLRHDVAVPDGRHGLERPPHPQPHGGEGPIVEEVLDDPEDDHRDQPDGDDEVSGVARPQPTAALRPSPAGSPGPVARSSGHSVADAADARRSRCQQRRVQGRSLAARPCRWWR
jgi:hypothetical protein